MNEWISNNYVTLITLILTPFVTWFISKRHHEKLDLAQKKTSLEGNTSDNISKNLDLYQRLFEDLSEKLLKAHETINELEEELSILKKKHQELRENK